MTYTELSLRNNIVTYIEKPPSDLICLSYIQSHLQVRHTEADSVESIVGLFNIHCYIMPMYAANMIPISCFQDSAEDYHDKKHPDGANTLQTQQVLLQALFSCVSPSI